MPATRPARAARRRRAPSPLAPVSLADLKAGPPALGVGRATLYDALARGERPVQVITVGRRMKVLTHSVIALLDPASGVVA